MRTTVTLDEDVASAVTEVRRVRSVGVSEAINSLIRAGLLSNAPRPPYVPTSHDLGPGIDVTNVAEALEALDGPDAS